jgi:hypothetical protein
LKDQEEILGVDDIEDYQSDWSSVHHILGRSSSSRRDEVVVIDRLITVQRHFEWS